MGGRVMKCEQKGEWLAALSRTFMTGTAMK